MFFQFPGHEAHHAFDSRLTGVVNCIELHRKVYAMIVQANNGDVIARCLDIDQMSASDVIVQNVPITFTLKVGWLFSQSASRNGSSTQIPAAVCQPIK
jgi:hypothetical protein